MAQLLLHLESGDVVAIVDESHSVGDLVRHLTDRATTEGLTVERTGRWHGPDESVADIDLLSGDTVRLGRHSIDCDETPPRALVLDVVAGPDSGRSLVLRPGATVVGRSSRCDLALCDRSVSRRHVIVTVAPTGDLAVLAEPGASNGVTIEREPVAAGTPRALECGATIELGSTTLVVRRYERRTGGQRDRLGQVDFHPTPYRPPIVSRRDPAEVGPIPTRPGPRRVQIVAALAPLLAGVVMFAVTRHAQYLLLTLVSPVAMIGTALDDRRTGRRDFRTELAEFRAMLDRRTVEFAELRRREARERREAAPDLAELVRRAELRTIDLWARGRDAPDLLRLRLGLGDDDAGSFDVRLAAGGDDDLRAEAASTLAGADRLTDVPVVVDLVDCVLGVHGPCDLVVGVAASLLVQVATLHSPDGVTVVAAVGSDRHLGWLKWLPHVRSVVSPVAGHHVVGTTDEADSLVARLTEVATYRTAAAEAHERRVHRPRVLAVIDAALRPDPAALARLLDLAPRAGISVLWLAADASAIPRQAVTVVELLHGDGATMRGRLWSTDPTVADRHLDVEHLRPPLAARVARSLAAVRDASTASQATSIPRTAPLFDVLGTWAIDPAHVAATWQTDRGHRLRFPIGLCSDGPLELDLVHDGPHTLVGGTSGAGKSELLQSLVIALAARHSPERLNFLFVDYKGGASSQVFTRLPHTVGQVTNLSADLAVRALTSLRTELNRRMAMLDGRAKDLAEMLERHPAETPASLVIVCDEFATLVKEIPEFVDGIVDIAQRGRSLGIHLVLATQRPTGSVNDNILANTNLRISLRMLDRAESTAILDAPDAADIPVPLRGRAFARLGPGVLTEFQSAFAGASLGDDEEARPVVVAPFDRPGDAFVARPPRRSGDDRTQLDAVIDAVVAANSALSLPPPRRPWRDVLPEVVTVDSLWADPEASRAREQPGRCVLLGMLDAPEAQEQRPAIVDLESTGGLVVFGTGGSGKTTLLRSIVVVADRAAEVSTLVIDAASRGLRSLAVLPSVVDVATGDDLEAVTRHLLVLEAELDRRRRLLATAGAEHLTAYNSRPDIEPLDRILVVIDGFGALADSLFEGTSGFGAAADLRWADVVQRIVVDGRQVGIHSVIAADRRTSVGTRLQSAIGARLVLRHADPQSYADFGIHPTRAEALEAPVGRALLDGRTLVQVASVSADPSARGQATAVAEQASSGIRSPTTLLASRSLPDRLGSLEIDDARHASPTGTDRTGAAGRSEVDDAGRSPRAGDSVGDGAASEPGDGALTSVVGIADVTGAPVDLDLGWSHALVVGPARSGRSTALVAIFRGLGRRVPTYVIGPAASPLRHLDLVADRSVFGRASAVAPVLDRVANLAAVATPEAPTVVIVDDLDGFDDPILAPLWERLVAADGVRLVAAIESRSATGFTMNAAVSELRRCRRQLVLGADDPTEFLQLTGLKLPIRPGLRIVPGRAVLLTDRRPTVVQIVC